LALATQEVSSGLPEQFKVARKGGHKPPFLLYSLVTKISTRTDWLGRHSRDGTGMCYYTRSSKWLKPHFLAQLRLGAGGVGGRTLFQLNADAALGSFTNALKAITVYGASGSTSGLGSAFVAEMTLSAGTSSGTYAPLEIELNAPTGASTGTRTSFIYASTQGAGVAAVDDNAVFFNLQGVTAGAGHLLVAGATLGTAYGGLRVRVGNANYWVPLYAAEPT
jgi:hypothetical protein